MVLAVFLLSVYGLSTAVAVLKAGRLVREPLKAVVGALKGSPWGLPWRVIEALVKCPPCLSFWIGLAGSKWVLSPSLEQVLARGGTAWTAAVVDGLAACGASWILHVAAVRMSHGIDEI